MKKPLAKQILVTMQDVRTECTIALKTVGSEEMPVEVANSKAKNANALIRAAVVEIMTTDRSRV